MCWWRPWGWARTRWRLPATAYTTVVVTVPGMGDDIQAIKAGILEVADILVINKADREGASRTYQELMRMLELRTFRKRKSAWRPPVLLTQAKDDRGHRGTDGGGAGHREFLAGGPGGTLQAARITRVRQEFLELLKEGVFRQLLRQLTGDGRLEGVLENILAKRIDPYSASEALIQDILGTV